MKFTPLAAIFTTASLGFGSGTATSASVRTSGPPVFSMRIAFMRTAYTRRRAPHTLDRHRRGGRRGRDPHPPRRPSARRGHAARILLLRRLWRRAVLSGRGAALSVSPEAHRRARPPLRRPRRRHLLAQIGRAHV